MKAVLIAMVPTLLLTRFAAEAGDVVALGSKRFTESFVLAEIAKRSVEEAGFQVEHRQGMGGTIILWEALRQGSIAAYPEYTGTIQEEIIKRPIAPPLSALREQLAQYG